MFKTKARRLWLARVLALTVASVIPFSALDAFSQKGGKGRYRSVHITKGEGPNSYVVIERGHRNYFLQINDAEDPLTGKKVEGEKEVEFTCEPPSLEKLPYVKRFFFKNGGTERKKIECLPITARILIPEEPE